MKLKKKEVNNYYAELLILLFQLHDIYLFIYYQFLHIF